MARVGPSILDHSLRFLVGRAFYISFNSVTHLNIAFPHLHSWLSTLWLPRQPTAFCNFPYLAYWETFAFVLSSFKLKEKNRVPPIRDAAFTQVKHMMIAFNKRMVWMSLKHSLHWLQAALSGINNIQPHGRLLGLRLSSGPLRELPVLGTRGCQGESFPGSPPSSFPSPLCCPRWPYIPIINY